MSGTSGMPFEDHAVRMIRRGGCAVTIVRASHVIGGRVFYDVWDPASGRTWYRVPVVVQGGGAERTSYVPMQVGKTERSGSLALGGDASQAVVMYRDGLGTPIIVGTVQSRQKDSVKVQAKRRKPTAQDKDRDSRPGPKDWFWSNGGARFLLTEDGELIFDSNEVGGSAQTKGNVNFQLGKDRVIRVSREGKDTVDRLMRINGFKEWAGKFNVFVAELVTWVNEVITETGVAWPGTGPSEPYITAALQKKMSSALFRISEDEEE